MNRVSKFVFCSCVSCKQKNCENDSTCEFTFSTSTASLKPITDTECQV